MSLNSKKWYWNAAETPAELHVLLRALGDIFDIAESADGANKVTFERITGENVISEVQIIDDKQARILYNTTAAAARGVGSLLAGLTGRSVTQFTMLGVMLDMSRNMVFSVPALEKLFRRLAILGFNTVLLYCEDTYKLDGEPMFGYMRGRYTAEEIRAIDDIGAALGIEVMGCIQTLGHMEQINRWDTAYANVIDTARVMRVDTVETENLIDKMLDFWGKNLRSRRIHVGMDEAHDLGLGRYLDANGYTQASSLLINHLIKVTRKCEEKGLKPMIWSDMFFRLSSKTHAYYDLDAEISQSMRDLIPENLDLVYWDYYTVDKKFYKDFLEKHRDLAGEPVMGSGIWIWSRLWFDHQLSERAYRACLDGCIKSNTKELFFTMWGDDGAICHWDSALTGLVEASDLAHGIDDKKVSCARYKMLTGSDFELTRLPGLIQVPSTLSHPDSKIPRSFNSAFAVFWDDLLIGLGYRNMMLHDPEMADYLLNTYDMILEKLADHRDDRNGADLNYAWLLVRYLRGKLSIRRRLVAAYESGDKAALKTLAEKDLPELAEQFTEYMQSFRSQWLRNAKVFGLETMQHRMGGQKERIYETANRITEYLDGVCSKIDELEEDMPEQPERMSLYRELAGGSVLV